MFGIDKLVSKLTTVMAQFAEVTKDIRELIAEVKSLRKTVNELKELVASLGK